MSKSTENIQLILSDHEKVLKAQGNKLMALEKEIRTQKRRRLILTKKSPPSSLNSYRQRLGAFSFSSLFTTANIPYFNIITYFAFGSCVSYGFFVAFSTIQHESW